MAGQVNDNVNVTAAEIIQGAGQLTIDGVDVGGFQGGVVVTYAQTEVFVESDWLLGPVDSEITNVDLQVSTELEQATLENLATAWGMNSSSVASGSSSKVLDLIPEKVMREVELVFEGMSATNREEVRTYTVYRAVRIGSSQTTLNRGVKTTIPVTFKCLLRSSDDSFGQAVDTTI